MNFSEAIQLARDVGYTHWLKLNQRRRETVSL
jgi:hypothetical protein